MSSATATAIRPATAALATHGAFIGRPGDFDFLVGRWQVRNRRLRQRGVGCDEWDEFPGVEQAWSHLNGTLSVDEIHFPTLGFSGATVRTLDAATRLWSIYWINSRQGRLFPPVTGGWDGERGEFYGDDEDEGRPVRVRFVWQRQGRDRASWEQSFSAADGSGWELNWTMAMARL